MRNLFAITSLFAALCSIGTVPTISMEDSEFSDNQILESQKRLITYRLQVQKVKNYISQLDCEPNAG